MNESAFTIYAPIALMLILGLPHGALDAHILNSAARDKVQILVLLLAYTLLAVATVLFWWALPTVAIIMFLGLSAIHFGRSDLTNHHSNMPSSDAKVSDNANAGAGAGADNGASNHLKSLAHGGIWTLLLPLIQWDLVEPIFDVLGSQTVIVKPLLQGAALVWGVCLVVTTSSYLRTRETEHLIVLFAGVSGAILLPPLWALCLYFCFWHARRHTYWVLSTFPPRSAALRFMVVFTVVPLAVMLFWALFIPTELNLEGLALQLFFIGIFALTVPHMLLIDYYLGSKPTVDR